MRDKLLNLIRLYPTTTDGDYDWATILKLAEEQSVMGVALKRAQKLPSDKWPPRKVLLQWIGCYNAIEQQNEKVNAVLSKLIAELESHEIKPIVVKGQVIAQEYEEPLARQSGDIDIYVERKNWSILENWIRNRKLTYSQCFAEKHIETIYEDIAVEFHFHLNAFASKKAMIYWEKEIEGKSFQSQRLVAVNDTLVRTLGITDTLVHLMVHTHHHLLTEGVGLRQLMDMCLFIRNHFDEFDLSLLYRHIVGIGHEKAFNAYMALLNKYLGLPKEQVPFELDLRDYIYADKIMEEVWHGGNFGHKNILQNRMLKIFKNFNTIRLVITHCAKFYHLAPQESLFYWIAVIFWKIKRRTSIVILSLEYNRKKRNADKNNG